MSEFCPHTYKSHPARLEYPWTFPMPSIKERDRRWQAIKKSMERHNLDCLIVSSALGYMPVLTSHLYYITNYVAFATYSGPYLVFPLKGEPQLGVTTVIGPQYIHTAMETSWISEIVGSLYPAQDIIKKIKQLKLEKGRLGIVGYKTGVFSASVYDVLREGLQSAHFEDATAVLAEAMNEVSRSSEEELALLKKACNILDLSFNAVAEALKPGVTECELWAAAEYAIVKNGGWYAHFMIATSGPSPIFMRAPAAHNTLSRGDVVMFEINGIYGGVAPQISYALSLGQPKREVQEMFELCDQLYQISLTELEKNRTFMDVELDLANRIHNAGYEPMTPQIHKYNMSVTMPMNIPPQPGDYFTVHPNMCTKDYTSGAKFGDPVHITKDGKVERLQKTAAKLHII